MVTSFFKHDSNARNDEKLIKLRMRHRAAGYGVYFMILERLRDETEHVSIKDYNIIAFDLREDASLIKSVVEDFGLFVFTDDGKYFYSERLVTELRDLDASREKRSKAGKLGMAKRWGTLSEVSHTQNQESDNNVITMLSKNDNYIREDNIRKEISSSLPSPCQSKDEDIEEEDEEFSGDNIFKIHNEAFKLRGIFDGRRDSADGLAILRFFTDSEKVDQAVTYAKNWPKDRPLYELRQSFESMEMKKQLMPMSYEDWTTISWLKAKLNLAELKKVIDIVGQGNQSTWDNLVSVVSSCKTNSKIEKPGRYVMKCLFNT